MQNADTFAHSPPNPFGPYDDPSKDLIAASAGQLQQETSGEIVRPYRRHIPELDGIRGIAVAIVVFSHIYFDFQDIPTHGVGNHLLAIWVRVTKLGWIGVDIFFVLSGFLISGVLLDSLGRPHFYRNFYMRRILRIFPLYYLALLISLFWYHYPWRFVGLSSVFLANMSKYFSIVMVFGPLWSLSVEEHFYLFWPWLVRFLRPRLLAAFCGLVIVGEPLLRFYAFKHGSFNEYASWFRFDGMAMGAVLAIVLRSRFATSLKGWGFAILTLALVGALISAPFGLTTRKSVVGITLVYWLVSAVTAGIIALVSSSPGSRWSAPLRGRQLKFLGDVSFCVYLAHWLVLDGWRSTVLHVSGKPSPLVASEFPVSFYILECLVVWSASLLIGSISMKYFEGPIRDLRVNYR